MSETYIYKKTPIQDFALDHIDCFVIALNQDARCLEALSQTHKKTRVDQIIAIDYDGKSKDIVKGFDIEMEILNVKDDPVEFIVKMREIVKSLKDLLIAIDISCLHTPDIFSLMKLLKVNKHASEVIVMYSIPYDYEYLPGGFVYEDSIGDLKNYELFGYSGDYDANDEDATYVVFLGFEGSLSLKILDEADYKHLFLINGLPSLSQKYKDISLLNNGSAIKKNPNYSMLYVPADNPFETYNMLEENFLNCKSVSIAPLGTKATTLGICLYALAHDNVRIVYPVTNAHLLHTTNNVVETIVYALNPSYYQ